MSARKKAIEDRIDGEVAMQQFSVWQNAWKADYGEPLELTLPDDWDVSFNELGGDHMPPMTIEQMRERILNPIGMEPIRTLASRGHQAVIVFDDLSRATPIKEIAEIVLEELLAGGIEKQNIRFICALGTHGALDRVAMVHKLGEDIVRNYHVYNHNPFANLVELGKDKAGVPVLMNAEFAACDVRIGIGAIAPHPMNGFGGGMKMLFPGIAGFETTMGNHGRCEFTIAGNQKRNFGFRQDVEEFTRMAGPFFKIDAIVNSKLDIVDLYAGDVIEEFYEAIKSGAVAYATDLGERKDVVVANANVKYNEANIAVSVATEVVKPGGDIVLINHCETGAAIHYLFGAFGLDSGGPLFMPYEKRPEVPYDRVIFYTPWPDPSSLFLYDCPSKVIFATTWDEVLELLAQRHGAGTTATVFSDATISYFPSQL